LCSDVANQSYNHYSRQLQDVPSQLQKCLGSCSLLTRRCPQHISKQGANETFFGQPKQFTSNVIGGQYLNKNNRTYQIVECHTTEL